MVSAMHYPSSWRHAAIAIGLAVPLTTFALRVGTGGECTLDYYKGRGTKGYAYVDYCGAAPTAHLAAVRSSQENLAHIRRVLIPAITDIAYLFNVSRQAVYDWQSGKPTADLNAEKLQDLAAAADILTSEGLTVSRQLLHRKLNGGNSLFEMVRNGGSAVDAARLLVSMVHQEMDQRRALESRLASRKPPVVKADDYGVPMLIEES
jgi:hypothetical protein